MEMCPLFGDECSNLDSVNCARILRSCTMKKVRQPKPRTEKRKLRLLQHNITNPKEKAKEENAFLPKV